MQRLLIRHVWEGSQTDFEPQDPNFQVNQRVFVMSLAPLVAHFKGPNQSVCGTLFLLRAVSFRGVHS